MIAGIPREIKKQESRVSMVPLGVRQLVRRGVKVLVESGAGVESDYLDEEFVEAAVDTISAPASTNSSPKRICAILTVSSALSGAVTEPMNGLSEYLIWL